jgi:two-component system chemotaxis response regulator CheB
VEIVAIGASTGGPNALADLFAHIPRDCPAPIVIVQHMPPMFTRLLAERLAARYGVVAEEAVAGRIVEPGRVWVAAGDYHLSLVRDGGRVRLQLHQGPPENSCRPAVDVLFRSVAQIYGAQTLAVVLTGMGQDGLRGCETLRETGAAIVVQDEPTSVVWGMPGAVARAGLADAVLPLAEIGPEIVRRVREGRPSR